MHKHEKLKTIIALCCFYLLYPSCVEGREAKFADLLVTNNAENILVYARVTNCFTGTMESAILAGVPTTFTFLFDFYQERPYWPDNKLAHRTVKHTIKYDNVKKIFHVSSSNGSESAAFQTFDGAKRAMADLNGVAVVPINALTKGKPYYLMAKAKLDEVRLPLHMEYLFFFVSLWDFETDWYMQKVKY
jgi:hypothetical protein